MNKDLINIYFGFGYSDAKDIFVAQFFVMFACLFNYISIFARYFNFIQINQIAATEYSLVVTADLA